MAQTRADEPREVNRSISFKHLAVSALILGCASFGAVSLNSTSWTTGNISILWPSTGLLIGILLCLPRRQWPIYIAMGFCLDVTINTLPPVRQTFPFCAYLALCNVVEVSLGAWLLYPALAHKRYLAQPRQLISLLVFGVVLAPAVASFFAALCVTAFQDKPLLQAFSDWYSGDALGISILTPLYLSFQMPLPFSRRKWHEIVSLLACLCAVSVAVFWQTSLPLLFAILPVLLLVEVRLGMAGAALGLLAVSVIGGFFTAIAHGPIGLTHLTSLSARTLVLQVFTLVCMLVVYIAEAVRTERNQIENNLRASEQQFRVLAEESRDIITLSDRERTLQYVSPAVKALLGWEPAQWLQMGRAQIVHPDDLPSLDRLYVDCLAGKTGNTLDFRGRKVDGSYLWVEANLVLRRDPETSEPIGFIDVVHDISSRKAAEEEMSKALNVAENRATRDPLTGIANRRCLDEYLESEWQRAMRTLNSIAVLMIDVDYFKQYNDMYGHLLGDNCLKQVASALASSIRRPADFLARYGGEEFVVVLADTDAAGAQSMAELVRAAVELKQIPHEGNPRGVVTISVGCAAVTPEPGVLSANLLMSADGALYQAKSAGRNCVRFGWGKRAS